MRILPVNFNIFIQKPAQTQLQTNIFGLKDLGRDSFELSFKGTEAPSYIEQAKEFSGIHCPICGHAMLNQKEFETILERAGKIETPQEFYELMQEYKDYVPSGMHRILQKKSDKDNDFYSYFHKHSKIAYLKHKSKIESSNQYLLDYAKDLPPEKQKEISDFVASIKPTNSSYTYGKGLHPILKTLNLQHQDYFKLINNTVLSLQKSSDYIYVFKIPEVESKSPAEISKIMAFRIFSKALMHEDKISRTQDLENPNNEILTCASCHGRSKGKTFLNQGDSENPELKENIRRYLQDISINMGQKDLKTNAPYIYYLCSFISKVSKQAITFSKEETDTIKKLNFIASRHSEFSPINQTKTDVPCAGCGSTLLVHDIKQEIEQELSQRNSVKGYVGLLKKYDKYIGSFARDNANLLIKIAEENPKISKDELIRQLQTEADKQTDTEIKEHLKELNKTRVKIYKKNTLSEAQNFDAISNAIFKYYSAGKFKPDYNYMKFVSEALAPFDLNTNTPVQIYSFLNKIKIACFKNSLVKVNEYDLEKDKNSLHTIIYKIFNSNLATTDHFIAVSKGGEKETNNLIGLCKTCNRIIKGHKQVFSWFIQNPEVRTSFLEHLKTINEMAKRKEIEGYDNWADTIAQQMYEHTHGKYDIRDQFEESPYKEDINNFDEI